MGKSLLMFIALCAIGFIAEITTVRVWFGRDFFGPTEDLVAIAGATAIAALILVAWVAHAGNEVSEDVREEEFREDRAESGQGSLFAHERGSAIRDLTGTSGRRFAILISAYERFGWKFLIFGAGLCAIAIWMMATVILSL